MFSNFVALNSTFVCFKRHIFICLFVHLSVNVKSICTLSFYFVERFLTNFFFSMLCQTKGQDPLLKNQGHLQNIDLQHNYLIYDIEICVSSVALTFVNFAMIILGVIYRYIIVYAVA